MRIKKTVVGSFPRICSSIEDSIRAVIDLQLRFGVDLLSDGEQRYDMISYFHQLPGLVKDGDRLLIGNRIEGIVNVNQFMKIIDFEFAKECLKSLDKKEDVKTALTGPITLGMTCAINGIKGYYENISDFKIYDDLCEAIEPIVIRLLELGSFVQIDEPGLSGGFMRPGKAVKIIDKLLKNSIKREDWRDKISIHVCGNVLKVKRLFDELLNLDAMTLSLAFSGKGEEENVKVLSRDKIEKLEKRIGVGCVNVQVNSIEEIDDVETILSRLKRIVHLIGLENIAYVHPDCGLKNNSIEVAEKIIGNLDKSTKLLVKEL